VPPVLSACLLVALAAACLLAGFRAGRAASRREALHDVLTGLPNRALFTDRVERALAAARRDASRPVLMLLDLDRFKEVNDTLGHHHGDELLRQIGPRIGAVLRSSDTVARLGGDEFAVLLPDADAQGAAEVGEKILEALHRTFSVSGVDLEIDASLGIAAYPQDGEDVETLVQAADVAMYADKSGRTGEAVAGRRGDGRDPLELMAGLRRAMDDGELSLVFQPKVHLAGGDVHGVEALVRWRHPERGLVLPSSFVAQAEHTGLMRPLTMHVIDQALAQARRWRDAGLDLRVAVNVSQRGLLDRGLAEEVDVLLERWDVPGATLELELTESTLMADPERAHKVLLALRSLGVRLAVDDFGTGWSSIDLLQSLPIEEIKIDRSFVAGMAEDRGDATVVRSTIDLAGNLGLRVTAEGVEHDQVRRRLAALGCDLGQGYLFSPPLDGEALGAWAADRLGLPPAAGAAAA
jgi:diguanylate cyclase (GGDEF)-like protein